MHIKVTFAASLLIIASLCLYADDGAASIAVGGVVVMRKEPRITMAREVLEISESKVTVDYDFRNDSDEDVTTEVAFPIPDYDLNMTEVDPFRQGFDDFKLWINGTPATYSTEARAYVKGKDYTLLLGSMRIDIASFGHATENDDCPDISRLPAAQHKRLQELGLIDKDYYCALWQVRKKYYWRQTFPAHKVVHIRHEYTPVLGGTNSVHYAFNDPPDLDMINELDSLCVAGQLRRTLRSVAESKDKDAPYFYVDFILTSANTWKTPIEDFTLIVDRPHEKDAIANYVSFCWNGPVTRVDADHFSVHAVKFLPTKELRIGFFAVSSARY